MTPEEYWARPWKCVVNSRFFSGTWMFNTFDECLAYAKQQWDIVTGEIAELPSYQGQASDYRVTIQGDEARWLIYYPYFRS